jgi:peptide deformylase
MALRPLVLLPDPLLRQKSEKVAQFDDDLRQLVADMYETMDHANGIGLAAVQVGVLKRVVVLDVPQRDIHSDKDHDHGEHCGCGDDVKMIRMSLINPEIVSASDEKDVYTEGCLSIPEMENEVERPMRVTISYQDEDGATHQMDADGLLAICIQHEIDHLNGVLFIDHLSRLKRERLLTKYKKAQKTALKAG